jgi:cysteine-rich repeat protein
VRTLAVIVGAGLMAGCSVDPVRFTLGTDHPAESCSTPGDEDGNGLADCADPACKDLAACKSVCGNRQVEAGEACDDGNTVAGDGCENNCTITGTGAYAATSDAMISISTTNSDDRSTSFGKRPTMCTFASSFGSVQRSLAQFDLTALSAGATLQAAYLNVRMTDQLGADMSVDVHEVSAAWSEDVVTWDTQPGFTDSVASSLDYQGYRWWRFDVKDLVQRWVATPDANHGLVLMQRLESIASGGESACFDSREGLYSPYLDVVVATP